MTESDKHSLATMALAATPVDDLSKETLSEPLRLGTASEIISLILPGSCVKNILRTLMDEVGPI